MKIRKGYVGNSSSSSFICDICWKEETVDNYKKIVCENGHVFSSDCLKEYIDISNELRISKTICPCCTLKHIAISDIHLLLYRTLGINQINEVLTIIRNNYTNREDLLNFINNEANPNNINIIEFKIKESLENKNIRPFNLRA